MRGRFWIIKIARVKTYKTCKISIVLVGIGASFRRGGCASKNRGWSIISSLFTILKMMQAHDGILVRMNESGNSKLSLADVAALQDSAPNTTFHYTFSLFSQTLSTTDEEVVYKKYSIGNEGEEQLREALAVMDMAPGNSAVPTPTRLTTPPS